MKTRIDFSVLDPETITLRDLYVFMLPRMKGYERGKHTSNCDGEIISFEFTHIQPPIHEGGSSWRTDLQISYSCDITGPIYHFSISESSPAKFGETLSYNTTQSFSTHSMKDFLLKLDWLFNDFEFDPFLIYTGLSR